MWMRDAYLNHDIPTIRDLTQTNKYFPYRYGEAFWSFIGSTYGDTVIIPFFKNMFTELELFFEGMAQKESLN